MSPFAVLQLSIGLFRQQASRFVVSPQQGFDLLSKLCILATSGSQKRGTGIAREFDRCDKNIVFGHQSLPVTQLDCAACPIVAEASRLSTDARRVGHETDRRSALTRDASATKPIAPRH